LQKIASPQSITNPIERQPVYHNKRKTSPSTKKSGEPLANSILHAANNTTNKVVNISQVSQSLQKS